MPFQIANKAEIPDEKMEVLQRAMEVPDSGASQEILKKAQDRGWLVSSADPISKTESALAGAGQGVTFGFGEELSAPLERGIGITEELIGRGARKAGSLLGLPSLSRFGKEAISRGAMTAQTPDEQLIAENRAILEAQRAANPKSFLAGGVVGAIPTTVALTATGAPLGGLVGQSAGLGALGALGASDTKAISDVVTGAFTGAALGGLGASAQSIGPALKRVSTSLARRATGMIKSVVNKVGGPERADKAIELLMSEGAIKGSLGQIAENVSAMRESAGKVIGDTLRSLDDAGVSGVLNAEKLAASIRSKPIPGTTGMNLGDLLDVDKTLARQFDDVMRLAKSEKLASGTFQAAQNFKQLVKERINFAKDMGEKNVYGRAYQAITESIDEAVGKMAPKIGNTQLAKTFRAAKELYGAARTAEKGIDSELARATGNKILGLTDYVMLSQGDLASVGQTAAKKVLESSRALAAGARGLRATGSLLETVGRPVGAGVSGTAGIAGQNIQGVR